MVSATDFPLLIIAFVVAFILVGGPFTLFGVIKIANQFLASTKVKFIRLKTSNPEDPSLGLLVNWDEESVNQEVFRVKVEATELVRGGRSTAFSYTFEGKGSKKKGFVIPLKISKDDFELLTDNGLPGSKLALQRTQILVEVENVQNESCRFNISKSAVRQVLQGQAFSSQNIPVEVISNKTADEWGTLSRVFPWRTVVEVAAAEGGEKKAHKPKTPGAPTLVDFLVTKVWIEPGCIVCDACENEAPTVFQVLPDTCIVREGADLSDGGSIKAAAEGCPVDVIKYSTVPKPAVAG
jgi:ferredoxin